MSTRIPGSVDFGPIVRLARQRFTLDLHGIHGLPHWQRVREYGLRIARHSGADMGIVELLACLHDCCREDDHADPGHGPRAAEFAASLRGTLLRLPDEVFERLYLAIRDHELGLTGGDPTIQTCWDADRLDLGRVNLRPDPVFLGTEFARRIDTIDWAYRQSRRASGQG